MDFDQLKKWMELAKKQQSDDFWKLFSDSSLVNDFINSDIQNGSPREPSNQAVHSKTFPPVDIYMTELEIIVLADLAGFKKQNLNVSISGTNLLLKGTFPSLIPVKPIHQERQSGDFERIVELPEPASSSDIRAKFENGLLMVWYKRKRAPEETVIIE
ncbi:Hsp20/alpha crystallin family protein [Neobacillus sp. SM06]|uniref:Hsp20/alpha crystallin family protein n=1 Tax=Neobacillus sp. SM06 TaxID=3422492 RepID=UPI003D2AFF2C